ncbi:MAG TPA: VCBS repeat-containing protein [Pyrinomonadaceae bacterium]|nr:VCBS repeat-containing protein [Pyrinomonadaceae bacterium]
MTSDYVVPGDYDGDGKTDFAVVREGASPTSELTWWILRSDGLGVMTKEFGLTGDDYLVQGDYDGDGRTEIAAWRKSIGTFFTYNLTTQATTQTQWGTAGDFPVAAYDNH